MTTSLTEHNLSIKTTAVGAIVILFAAIGWTVYPRNQEAHIGEQALNATSTSIVSIDSTATTNTLDQLATMATTSLGPKIMDQVLTSYETLVNSGQYSTTTSAIVGAQIGATTPSHAQFIPVSNTDVKTTNDTSKKGMLVYRSALQKALKPLMANTQSEIGLFSQYINTQDETSLTALSNASQNYLLAASNTLAVVAPIDAINIHTGIINAMREFSAAIDTMIREAHDPIGSVAALKMYSQAHSDMITSFNNLATYVATKQ